jgi:hypothetical protein
VWARSATISCAVALFAATAGPASAQSADAEALFRDGRRLIQDGKLAEGCDKLEASVRIESTAGSLLNLGDCREKLDQLARAWAAFAKGVTAATRDHDAKRGAEARRRANLLEPKLARLTIKVRKRVDGEHVERDTETIDPAAWNSAVPIDAGSYQISAGAPGFETWFGGLTIRDGAQETVDVPALAPNQVERASEPAGEPATAPVTAPATRRERVQDRDHEQTAEQSSFTGVRKIAIGVGGGGLAALAAGAGFALEARSHHNSSNALCPMATCSDLPGVELEHNAQTDAKLANVGFAAGGALVGGAVVMWLVGGPPAPRESISIVPAARGTGLALEGSF